MEINRTDFELYKKLQQQQLSQVNNNNINNKNSNNLVQQTQSKIINNIQNEVIMPSQVRMNNLASIDRAVYIKNIMNLPKNMSDLFVLMQNNKYQATLNNTQNINSRLQNNLLRNAQLMPHQLLHQQ